MLESCTILTRPAEGVVAPVHDRMPLMLDPAGVDAWLAPDAEGEAVLDALVQRPVPAIAVRRVSKRVGDVRIDDAACIEAEADPASDPGPLFGGALEDGSEG